MIHLTSGWCLVVEIGIAAFCLLDVAISPEAAVQWIPRWGWALMLLAFPVAGTIAWLSAGHPWRLHVRRAIALPAPPPVDEIALPDDVTLLRAGFERLTADQRTPDLTLAEELLAVQEEHERTLLAWETDLRRREAALLASSRTAPD